MRRPLQVLPSVSLTMITVKLKAIFYKSSKLEPEMTFPGWLKAQTY